MKCFGIYDDGDFPNVVGNSEEASGTSYEDTITPLMNALVKFRDDIKANAGEGPKTLFQLCDALRDDILPFLGVALEDKAKGEPSIWKLEDKAVLIAKRDGKVAEKLKKEEEKKAREDAALKKKSTSGKDWFRVMESDKYSQFDEATGLPTHDASGKALHEQVINGLKKVQTKQQGVYEKWLAEQNKQE